MNAEKARALNDEYFAREHISVTKIHAMIEIAAKTGKVAVQLHLDKINRSSRTRLYQKVKQELTSQGFKVTRSSHSGDCRLPRGYDVMTVSW